MTSAPRSLRILICNYEYPPIGGGGGTASQFLAKELLRLGHSVEVVTTAFRDTPRDFREGAYRVRRLPAPRHNASRCEPYEMASYAAMACAYLFFRGGPKPDALISFHSIPSGMAAWPLSILWRKPHVIMFCGGDVPGNVPDKTEKYHKRTKWLNRMIVRQAAARLANSNGLAALARSAFPGVEIGIVRNGVDPEVFAPAPGPRGEGELRMLFVGRLCAEKALDILFPALRLVKERRPALRWRLTIAGDGPERPQDEAWARENGVADHVRFTGWLNRAEIPGHYRDSDIFLLPSRFEGMPNVVLEAMASGLPVIGTQISGTEELVIPGRTGLLAPPNEAEPLAAAILELADQPALRQAMGKAAREEVLRAWTWEQRAKELEAILLRAAETFR